MRRKLPVINFLLILILFLLLGWGGYSWWQPQFSSTVKRDGIVSAQRELITPTLARQPYSKAIAGDVTRLNLFRKQRKKFYRPKPPKPKYRPKPIIKPAPPQVARVPLPPAAPPPQLILTGVVLLNGNQVAIFEGTYSDVRSGKLVQNLKPRRRGYKIGESLGGYKIEAIHKTYATLTAIKGKQLTLKVSKSSALKKIQRTGPRLTQKNKVGVQGLPRPPAPPAPFASRKSKPAPPQFNSSNRNPRPPGAPPVFQVPGTMDPMMDPSQRSPQPPLRQSPTGF